MWTFDNLQSPKTVPNDTSKEHIIKATQLVQLFGIATKWAELEIAFEDSLLD